MRERRIFSEKQFIIFNTLILGVLFLYSWLKSATQLSSEGVVFWPGAYFLSLWILSHGIFYQIKWRRLEERKQFLFHHTTFSVLFGVVHFVLTGILILLLERFFRLPEHYILSTIGHYFSSSWHFISDGVIWYWTYTGVILLFYFRQRLHQERQKMQDMRRELTDSDLNTLSTELNPHFLFNAMNSIAMKVRLGENKLAVAMIASLNDLLRAVIYRKVKMVSLAEELELLDKYLMIEKTRFGEHVEVELRFPKDLHDAMVPRMILQPLVENAFKHGMCGALGAQNVRISAERESNRLILVVFNTTNTKSWIVTGDQRSGGVGLSNVIQRLRGLYGTRFRFQSQYLAKGISFKITIPLQTT